MHGVESQGGPRGSTTHAPPLPQGPANKYISLRDRRSRRGDTIFGAKFSIRLFRYYIKFLNKENMHTYSYGVLLYSDGRMPPLVALFADLYQFCTRYVKSNNDLCSADVLTIARNTRQVNTSAEHRSLLLVSCPPFSTYGLGVRYICSLAPVPPTGLPPPPPAHEILLNLPSHVDVAMYIKLQ